MVTKYIGPLEEMVLIYQVYKSLGKVEHLAKRDPSAGSPRILLEEYGEGDRQGRKEPGCTAGRS